MFEAILLAVDGSEPSRRAATVAGDLASRLGSDLIVLHVKEKEIGRGPEYEEATREEAVELVDGFVRMLKESGVSARGQVSSTSHGRAARAILEAVEDNGAMMIVMGTRGLSDMAGLVMGSVAHKLLHLARVPVLVVR